MSSMENSSEPEYESPPGSDPGSDSEGYNANTTAATITVPDSAAHAMAEPDAVQLAPVGVDQRDQNEESSVSDPGPPSEVSTYIYMARNPFDCCAAYYMHMKSMPLARPEATSFDTFFDAFIEGKVIYGDFFDHVLSWYHIFVVTSPQFSCLSCVIAPQTLVSSSSYYRTKKL
ncbi:hypothetical protein HPB49_022379 [Dermacentor silvarum]|uniref:Uncharacterized protein n=1 Tax=Dermacentor silvarum TaxID=543639 RepID=A0ACB8CHS1_DERSI|nr:hypothetical protein HPB49_022379 [Dermacentor silvarum]